MLQTRSFRHGPEARWTFGHHLQGQLFMLDQGHCSLKTDSALWLVLAGRPCWVPPSLAHGLHSSGIVTGTCLLLDEQDCAGMPAEPRVLKPHPLLPGLVDRISHCQGDETRLRHLLAVLVDEMVSAEPDPLHLPLPATPGLRMMAGVLAGEPGNDRGIDEWCEAASISKRTFVRRFPAETGLTFVEWRRRARAMKAVELLHRGASVAEAAPAVGYGSLSAFITSFRQITGLSPRQFVIASMTLAQERDAGRPAP